MNLGDDLRKAAKVTWKARPEILLGPQIPKPMHGVNPRTMLGVTWWNQTRNEAYRSTSYHCAACGVWKHNAKGRSWLEGHELYEINYVLGTMKYLETVPLCHYCHAYVHRGRLDAMLRKGKITHAKYAAIIQHGDEVLRGAGITMGRQEQPVRGPVADWKDWRMLVGRRRVRPLYKDYEAWALTHEEIEIEEESENA